MNILIGIISYILGFITCMIFVRILVELNKFNKKIQKADEIIKKEKQRKAEEKIKENKVIKLVDNINEKNNKNDNEEE